MSVTGAKTTTPQQQQRRMRQLNTAIQKFKAAGSTSFKYLAPIFSLHGKPFSLDRHKALEPQLDCDLASRTILIAGRQIGKSTIQAIRLILQCLATPHFRICCLLPSYEQTRRFSSLYVKPFIENGPFAATWRSAAVAGAVLNRGFTNHSAITFSFTGLDPGRTRGISADVLVIDEVQDILVEHLAVVGEIISASNYKATIYSGTATTTDSASSRLWEQSSQGEYVIKCPHCGYWNMPLEDADLLKMIGPVHDHISEEYPGTICARCAGHVNPTLHGRWYHLYKDRYAINRGYHLPQYVFPLHYARPREWRDLVAKMHGYNGYSHAKFLNEVLGVACDQGQRLVSLTDLRTAGSLPWANDQRNPSELIFARLPHYEIRALAVDWGGSGDEDDSSFTVAAVLGIIEDRVDVLFAFRFPISVDHVGEAATCQQLYERFRCNLFIHDYTGAGTVRESCLVQSGFNPAAIMPIRLVRASQQSPVVEIAPSPLHSRRRWHVDKAWSLLTTCAAIKSGAVRLFQCDFVDNMNPGFHGDFLALRERKLQNHTSSDSYTVTRAAGAADDFAQAVNIGCVGLWYITKRMPRLAPNSRRVRLTAAQQYTMDGPIGGANMYTL